MSDRRSGESPFAIKVDNHLFLDSNNKFHAVAPKGAKVYELGGGLLSLSTATRGSVLSGTLAVIPLKEEPSWVGKLRKIGVDEDVLKFFGTAAELASCVVSVIGWVQGAIKILELLGILKTKPSLEDMVRQILTKLNLVQDMVAETMDSGVRLAIDTARGIIDSDRDACAFRWKTLTEDATKVLYDKGQRKAYRAEMIGLVEDADGQYRGLLSPSRWRFICQAKNYRGSWGFYTDPEETELKNPPWWSRPRHVPRRQLADDGLTWIPAVYPAAYKGRFDYRPALPHAIHGGLSLISMLQMAEPEFRTTGFMRDALRDYADAIETQMLEMRRGFVRSHFSAADFRYIDASNIMVLPSLGVPITEPDAPPLGTPLALKRPLFYWQVGALDLCAHNDFYFNDLAAQQATASGSPTSYKLGCVDFDWAPSDYQLRWVEAPVADGPWPGHWEIANAEECAAEANTQSEADYLVALQASGYFQLAQLHTTMKHLATDPEYSETVNGFTTPMRRHLETRTSQVTGYDGLFCEPITATASLKEYHCQTTVNITTQEPDRVHEVPTRFLLVALGHPAESDGGVSVLSEVELTAGQQEITLPAAWTFDFFVEKVLLGEEMWSATTKQLQLMRDRPNALPNARSLRSWVQLGTDYTTSSSELPTGDVRNRRFEPITVDCQFSPIDTDTRRGAWIRVAGKKGMRNVDNLYVVTEETLYSGNTLRTYFEVDMYTQITYVSPLFFQRERECLAKTARVVDDIERRFSESAPSIPPHVPVTVEVLRNRASQVRSAAPDEVERLLRRSSDPNVTSD